MHLQAPHAQVGGRAKDRVALATLDRNMMEARERRSGDKPHRSGAVVKGGHPRATPMPPLTAHSYLTPKVSHQRSSVPSSAPRSAGSGSSSSITPKSSPGSPMEVTPAPSSPASQDATPFRVPSLTPVAKQQSRHLLPEQAPHHRNKLTVVFDLDETLVSNRRPGVAPAIARHYLKHMFRLLDGLVEAVLWTASTEDTGRPVMQQIDPTGSFFHHVVYRNSKWFTDGVHTKDLTLLGRDLDRVMIIENTPNCCKLNPQNALMVEDFTGDLMQQDRTLLNIAKIIRGAAESFKKGVSAPRYLKYYARVPGTCIDLYELGLPTAFAKMSKAEAMARVNSLEPLMRPPLGIYCYAKKD